ncbi:MAG TPA: amidohydrolase [Thermomicrobiales bacterium]|nr:amidohydrolase [Thermomicrobiales bacterium]
MAEQVLVNGNVLTMDPARPHAEAVVLADDRIAFVGSTTEARTYAHAGARETDLGGRTLIPGFNEAHNHMLGFGLALAQVDAGYPAIGSIADLRRAVADRAATTPAGRWVRGRGYDDNKLAERRHPTRADLDAAAPDHPTIVTNASGHMSVVNGRALALAGVTRDTADPPGGRVVRDEHGEPTGLLQETAQGLVHAVIPPPTGDELREALRRCCAAYAAAGVTSSQDAGSSTAEQVAAYQEAREAGDLPLRVSMMIRDNLLPHLAGLGLRGRFGDDRLRVGPVKIFSDGSLIGRTAAVFEPFLADPRPDNLGMPMMPQEELDDVVWRAHSAGFQVATHAIGDRAIAMVLDAYERALTRRPRADHRLRIEHCGILRPELIARLVELRVLAVSQPIFITDYGDGFRRHLGEERIALTYPFRSLLDAGVTLVFSSDCPVSPFEPLRGMRAAVGERTGSGAPYAPQEALTVEEALRCYTVAGAYASFEERVKGRIKPGMLADLTVLGEDPRAVEPARLPDVPVTLTMVGGAVIHER